MFVIVRIGIQSGNPLFQFGDHFLRITLGQFAPSAISRVSRSAKLLKRPAKLSHSASMSASLRSRACVASSLGSAARGPPEMRGTRDRRDALASVAASAVRALGRLGLGVCVARLAGAEAFGLFALLLSVEVVALTLASGSERFETHEVQGVELELPEVAIARTTATTAVPLGRGALLGGALKVSGDSEPLTSVVYVRPHLVQGR